MSYVIFIAVVIIVIYAFRTIQSNKRENALLLKAGLGDAQAQFEVYQLYKENQAKSVEAIQFLEKAAENGHIEAQIELYELYRKEKNPSKAIDWLKKAIEQGSAKAQYLLAHCYSIGYGDIQKDMEQALIHFQKAAEQEHAGAQYEIALCYLRGDGVEEDKSKAIEWCKKAVANGSRSAQAIIGFKKVEEAPEVIRSNYLTIKDCCIELIKRGYEGGSCDLHNFESFDNQIWFSLYSQNDGWISFKLGTSRSGIANLLITRHTENQSTTNKLCHLIHLDEYSIVIESNVPRTEAPPECLKICAAILIMRGFKICDPEWVQDFPTAKQYVNSAFRELGERIQ
jgi:tetratricopeptide (TPR) repeat protein